MGQPSTLIGLGANLGDPPAQLRRAAREITGWPELRRWRVSSLYRGGYVGPVGPQPAYWNAVLEIEALLDADAIFARLRALESAIEGAPRAHQAPRRLDLDLLLAGSAHVCGPELELPHPRLRERRFVLEPLVELLPELLLPPDAQPARWLLAQPQIQSQELVVVQPAARWLEEERLCLP